MNHQLNLQSLWQAFFKTQGRMSRSRYWLISIPFWLLFWILFITIETTLGADNTWIVTLLFFTAAAILSTKRLHDRDKSGKWLLLVLIPVAGPIWVIVELSMLKGTTGDNRYGDNPLETNYDYLTVA